MILDYRKSPLLNVLNALYDDSLAETGPSDQCMHFGGGCFVRPLIYFGGTIAKPLCKHMFWYYNWDEEILQR